MSPHTIALLLLLLCRPILAQNATITFYSPLDTAANEIKSLAFQGLIPYFGNIFDGEHKMLSIARGHFVTLDLPAGQHVFSATLNKNRPSKQYVLDLVMKAGNHYFVRLTCKVKNVVVLFADPQLDLVDCSIASQDNARSHPLKPSYVQKEARSIVDPSTTVPPCP